MLHGRFVGSTFIAIGFTLCLVFLLTGRGHAAPVLADEQSLLNGAELYALYCSECHGRDPADTSGNLYAVNPTDPSTDYSALIETALGGTSPELAAVPVQEEWPEWADNPEPDSEYERDIRLEIQEVATLAIKAAPGFGPESYDLENRDEDSAGGFEPVTGATDLAMPETYFFGTSEEDLYHSIAEGTDTGMPGWRDELGGEEDLWDLVNYIRSFWSEEWLY